MKTNIDGEAQTKTMARNMGNVSYVSYVMFLWGVVVLELNSHPDQNKRPNRALNLS